MSPVEYLTGQRSQLPSLEALKILGLEGWIYYRLRSSDTVDGCRSTALSNAARHALVKTRLETLILTWNHANIEPFIFKGYALAEFIYSSSLQRFYGDVDLLLAQPEAALAVKKARELGWLENYHLDNSIGNDHEFSHLYTPDRVARVDLHLELLQMDAPSLKRKQFTEAIRKNAVRQSLGKAFVWIPQPVDHVIVLLLNRRWGDRWARKATDYTDLLAIQERYAVTRDNVLARAKELGCFRNVTLTLETCDPWLKKLKLGRPARWQQILWDLQCASELGSYEFDYYTERLRQAPSRLWHIWHSLPHLLEGVRKRKNIQDLEALISHFDARPVHPGVEPRLSQLFQWSLGVLWASKALRLRDNPCVPKSLALLRLLSQAGFTASFVSGVRKSNGRLEGHAWIEVNGLPLEADMQAPSLYKESFRYDNWLLRQQKADTSTPADDA
jgi:hypothetical protein